MPTAKASNSGLLSKRAGAALSMSSDHLAEGPAKIAEAEPHYHGHRERLRNRFREAGANALSDYELLELLLFRALPRRDVKALARPAAAAAVTPPASATRMPATVRAVARAGERARPRTAT